MCLHAFTDTQTDRRIDKWMLVGGGKERNPTEGIPSRSAASPLLRVVPLRLSSLPSSRTLERPSDLSVSLSVSRSARRQRETFLTACIYADRHIRLPPWVMTLPPSKRPQGGHSMCTERELIAFWQADGETGCVWDRGPPCRQDDALLQQRERTTHSQTQPYRLTERTERKRIESIQRMCTLTRRQIAFWFPPPLPLLTPIPDPLFFPCMRALIFRASAHP